MVRTLQVQGSYTGDTSSRVGLYTYVAGVLTLVASCTDDTALWKVAANTMGIKAFTTPYVAAAGLYFIGILYHSSAQTTAPTIVSALNVNNAAQNSMDLTNSAALSLTLATQLLYRRH